MQKPAVIFFKTELFRNRRRNLPWGPGRQPGRYNFFRREISKIVIIDLHDALRQLYRKDFLTRNQTIFDYKITVAALNPKGEKSPPLGFNLWCLKKFPMRKTYGSARH
jgi:hypothetical protein